MNITNYFTHKTIEPPYFQREFEHDIDLASLDIEWIDVAQRILLISLPFISLMESAAPYVSVSMGSIRSVSHIAHLYTPAKEGAYWSCAGDLLLTALAILTVVSTIFEFKLGTLVTTLADIIQDVASLITHLMNEGYEACLNDILQLISNSFYISVLLTGSLEVLLASLLFQACMSFIQALKEWDQERYPEVVAKIAMGVVRCYQAREKYELIKRRDAILSDPAFKQLLELIKKGKEIEEHFNSQFSHLEDTIEENRVTLTDAANQEHDFGSHFHGYGKGAVKGNNLCFRTKIVDDKEMVELDFKVNHVFRERLLLLLDTLSDLSDREETRELLKLTFSHAKDFHIEYSKVQLFDEIMDVTKIVIQNLGTISIGNSPGFPTLYNRVTVAMEKRGNIFQLHELLSFIGLEDAIKISSENDLKRLKMGQLFRLYFPKEATLFERSEPFFDLPIEELQQEMIKKAPSMKQVLEDLLPKMEPRELLPGRVRYALPGLAKLAYEQGARALIATIIGSDVDKSKEEPFFERVASIVKMGMLSSETRLLNEIIPNGASPSSDFYTGGADSIFTQLLNTTPCQEKFPLEDLYYWGNIRLLFSLEALETITYQYHRDSFGKRLLKDNSFLVGGTPYLFRENIFQFIKNERLFFHTGNEVMIKERIPPELIRGIIVPDFATKDRLLGYLKSKGLVYFNALGEESILNQPIDKFMRVGKTISEELISTT